MDDLYEIAKVQDITGRGTMTKDELVSAINTNKVPEEYEDDT